MKTRFKLRRPSPAMAVAMVALVMSMAGTATAARVLVTSSSQIKNGAVTSADIRNGTVSRRDLRDNAVNGAKVRNGSLSLDDLDASAKGALQGAGAQALEAFRKDGPQNQEAGKPVRIATLKDVPAGTYAIFAKTILTPTGNTGGVFKEGESVAGHCTLDAGGDKDEARALLATPGSLSPGVLNTQITRTFGTTGTVALDCDVTNSRFNASDTSIIAVRVGRSPRSPVEG